MSVKVTFNSARDYEGGNCITCTMVTCCRRMASFRSSRSSWRASEPSTSTRPRGLRVVTKEEEEEKKHSEEHDSLVYSFECLKRALLGKGELGGKEATEEALDDSECNTAFFCDVDVG